jgi:hypothetical protein
MWCAPAISGFSGQYPQDLREKSILQIVSHIIDQFEDLVN